MTVTFRPAVRPNRKFWRHTVFAPSGCWPWIGARFKSGYGRVRVGAGRTRTASRVAYELEHGVAVPDGVMVCHRCDNPPCCNPQHLFLGSALDNVRDCMAKGRRASVAGERHPSVKLTADQVRQMRERRAAGEPLSSIARGFDVTPANVSAVCTGKTWGPV